MSDIVKSEQNAVVLNDPALIFHQQWAKWEQIATTVYKAQMLNKVWDSPAKIMMGFMKCHELGLPAMTGISAMYIVNGKVGLEVNLMRAIIDASGQCVEKKITESDGLCRVYTKRKDGQEFTSLFTIQDARTAGLMTKDNWKSYPKDMLRARAEAINYRQQFSHLLHGLVYTPEELGAPVVINETGEVIVPAEIVFDEKLEFERINNQLRKYIENKSTPIEDIKQFIEVNLSDIEKLPDNKKRLIMNTYNMIAKKHGDQYVIVGLHQQEKPAESTTESANGIIDSESTDSVGTAGATDTPTAKAESTTTPATSTTPSGNLKTDESNGVRS